jgi:hypothetical protein
MVNGIEAETDRIELSFARQAEGKIHPGFPPRSRIGYNIRQKRFLKSFRDSK